MNETRAAGQRTESRDADSGIGPGVVVAAVLIGGPGTFPHDLRKQRVVSSVERIKIPHYGGYEHFDRQANAFSGDHEAIYEWVGRTRVAE